MNRFHSKLRAGRHALSTALKNRSAFKAPAAALLLALAPAAVGQNLVPSPSFESPVVGLPQYQNTITPNSSPPITGWRVSEGTVELVNPALSAPFASAGIVGAASAGDQAVNLASGVGRSAISMDIATAGNTGFTVTFDATTAKMPFGNGSATLQVVFGTDVRTLHLANVNPSLTWLPYTFSFTVPTGATLATLTLRSSDDPATSIALVDNVSITVTGGTGGTGGSGDGVLIAGAPIQVVTVDTLLPGNANPAFDPGTGFANIGANPVTLNKIEALGDGRLLVGGSFASYRGQPAANFARISPNGALDTTFFHGFGASARVNDFVVLTNGSIVLVGAFDAYNELLLPGIARILPDGGPDRGFTPGSGANGEVNTIVLQDDGRMIVGGDFSSYGGSARSDIARVLPSGRLDTSFQTGSGFNGRINDLLVLTNGQILAGGSFTAYNSVPRNGLVRLNADGSIDAGFIAPFESSAVIEEILLQPDGKILVAGSFSLTGGNGRRNIARLTSSGLLDPSFGTNSVSAGANGRVAAMERCADGSLIIAGDFTHYDGQTRNRIAKLNTFGFVDTSSLLITAEQVQTNNVVTTNVVPIVAVNQPVGTTNLIYGFTSNITFVALTTNIPPAVTNVSLFTTNIVVTTNNAISQSIPNLYLFGLNGGADGPVHDLAFVGNDAPVVGGAFSTVNGNRRAGLALLYECAIRTQQSNVGNTNVVANGPALNGTVVNAATGTPVTGANIQTLAGSAVSSTNGTFTIGATVLGTERVVITAPNFAPLTNLLNVAGNTPITATFALSPQISNTNTVRLVLTWNANPNDLDSYLDVPQTSGTTANQVSFFNRGSLLASPFASLDVDDVDGFGPETITITNLFDGVYNYYINRFSGTPGLSASGGRVDVFTSAGLVGTILVPTSGVGDYWHVLQINGTNRTFAVVNQITNAPPSIQPGLNYFPIINSGLPGGTNGVIDPNLTGAPQIVIQPEDLFTQVGGTVTLTAAANGTRPFHHQWYRNGQPVAGANSSQLTLTNLTVAVAGDYQLVITNVLGASTSRVAQVTALSATTPFVFLQPNHVVVDKGATATFEILAGGQRPLFYQWRRNGTNLTGQTAPLLAITNVAAVNTGNYDVIVANSHSTIFSRTVTLSVATPPVITNFTANPGPRVRAGAPASLVVQASGKPPFEYRWLFDGQLIPGAITDTLILPSIHFTNAGNYTVIVTNQLGATTNAPFSLTVDSPPLITMQPQNQFRTIGRQADLVTTAIGSSPIQYQWQRITGTNAADITGGTNATLSITNLQQQDVGQYQLKLTNPYGTNFSRVARVEIVLEQALLPWVQNLGGTGEDVGRALAVDAAGSVYIVGSFQGSATFGTNTLVSAGRDDIFVTRFDANGNVLWAKRFGGSGYDTAHDVAVGTNGDVYITGSFEGSASFGATNLVNADATSFSDLFVGRFDTNGSPVWLLSEGVIGASDTGRAIAVQGTNLWIGGQSSISSFGAGTVTGSGSVLLARLDTDGNRIWARKSGGGNAAALDSAHAVAVDAVGGVYIGGEFTSLTFTNGSVGLTNRGFTDGFIAKHDLAGNLLWMRQIGAAGSDSVRGLAVLPGTNGIAVAGQFSRTNDFGGSLLASTGGQLPDAFAASYTAEGALRWVRSFGGPATDSAADVAVDPLGNLFVTGSYQGTATFGDKTSVSIADTTDIFALRLDTNGVLVFMQQAGGDDIGGDTGLGIAVDGDGNGVFTGSFRGTLVAGSNSAESTGGNNAFVSRLVPPPSVHIRPEAGQIIISWPSAWPGFLLEANGGGLRQTNWTDTALTPVLVGDRYFITNTVTTNLQFFRLRRP